MISRYEEVENKVRKEMTKEMAESLSRQLLREGGTAEILDKVLRVRMEKGLRTAEALIYVMETVVEIREVDKYSRDYYGIKYL